MQMAFKVLASMLGNRLAYGVAPAGRVVCGNVASVLRLSSRVSAKQVPAAAPLDDEVDEFEDYDPMAGFNSAQRRRIMAMKDVQAKYDDLNREYQKELAALQASFQGKYAPLYDERKEIFVGAKAVGTYDIAEDGESDGPILEFWLTALGNHDKVVPYITERDNEVLAFLEDIRSEVLTGDDRGFKLKFFFRENPFFTNTVLEKTYIVEPEDDIVPKEFIGCKIHWKEGKDVTFEQVKKRVKAAKGDDKKAKAFVTENVPCDSFFNIFDPPKIPTTPDALSDEQMDELQEELTVDFDMGYAIKENVIPRAVEWFTGEIAPFPDDEYYEDEEPEDDMPPPPPPKRR